MTLQVFSCFLPHMLDDDLGVFVARCVIVQDLLSILHRLELLSLVWILAGLKELDEGVVRHILPGIDETLSL